MLKASFDRLFATYSYTSYCRQVFEEYRSLVELFAEVLVLFNSFHSGEFVLLVSNKLIFLKVGGIRWSLFYIKHLLYQ